MCKEDRRKEEGLVRINLALQGAVSPTAVQTDHYLWNIRERTDMKTASVAVEF
jgi:hypothetical protein